MLDKVKAKISCEQYIIERGELLSNWRTQQTIMKELAGRFIYIRVGGENIDLSPFTSTTPAVA